MPRTSRRWPTRRGKRRPLDVVAAQEELARVLRDRFLDAIDRAAVSPKPTAQFYVEGFAGYDSNVNSATADRRLAGHAPSGPSGVSSHRNARTRSAIAPAPAVGSIMGDTLQGKTTRLSLNTTRCNRASVVTPAHGDKLSGNEVARPRDRAALTRGAARVPRAPAARRAALAWRERP